MTHARSVHVSRRAAVQVGAIAAAGTALATWSGRAAQEATPAAGAVEPEFLFIQAFSGGTLAPAGSEGAFTLTLTGGVSRTLYFSDRPERLAGLVPTVEYIDILSTIEDDPPNAALVAALANGTDGAADATWIVALLAGAYDRERRELRYDLRLIEPDDAGDTRFAVTPNAAPTGAVPLGAGHLFIDDANSFRISNQTDRQIGIHIWTHEPD